MKKYLLGSLCAITPFLAQAEERGMEFESEIFEEQDRLVYENLDDELEDVFFEKEEPKQLTTDDITYQNTNNVPPMQDNRNTTRKQQQYENDNGFVDHPGVFGFAEFLWWKLNETGLDYAVHKKIAEPLPSNGSDLFLGTTHRVDLDWNPGFRVGLGYRFSKDLWELSGVYTYYYTKGDDKVTCKNCTLPNSAKLPDIIAMTVASSLGAPMLAKANVHFWYHVGDIELAKPLNMGKNTSARFVVGPTMAFIQQHFRTTSMDNLAMFPPCLPQITKTKMDWNFSGGGIKIGADSQWNVFNHFNFLFGAYFSALYGVYVNKWISTRTLDPPGVPPCAPGTISVETPYGDTKIKDRRNVFGSRIFGGVGFNYPFNSFDVELYVNFELNTWFNLTDQYRLEGNPSNFDKIRVLQTPPLNLAGFDFGVKVNF